MPPVSQGKFQSNPILGELEGFENLGEFKFDKDAIRKGQAQGLQAGPQESV